MLRVIAAWPLERLVGLGLVAAALIFTLLLGALAQRGLRSLTWPVIAGVVTQSRVSWSLSDGKSRYSAQVEYTYDLAGHAYRSRTWTYRSQEPTEAFAGRIVARYPEGHAVSVHYDPAAPSRAVLEPGTDVFVLAALGVSALILILGLGLTVSTIPPVSTLLEQSGQHAARRRLEARRANARGPQRS
ncbi:DUF3592 domain-containing protein [Deinococcus apachensis]|uniref:DUF3592 domain-containing protein n=1 Tax=Deinococcus apachensis TaxID=309886 RepID=UPI0003759439|nr:DUF3592 domain-containing protein [Deinococcus apachensis]